jgi:SAM-dependent methyltransferase
MTSTDESGTDRGTRQVGTSSEDYDAYYYSHYSGPSYDVDEPHWIRFFGNLADRLISLLEPTTSLDAGCAKGILVGSLVERGVDAHGVDVSEHAIENGDPRAAGRLSVQDLTKPIEGRYDMVTCIEVIEHLSQGDAELALDNLCAVTDRLVLTTTPFDLRDVTHVNVRLPQHWAAMLAERGFFRRPDVDLAFIAPWAVMFQRGNKTVRETVFDYEAVVSWAMIEVAEKRSRGLELARELAKAEKELAALGVTRGESGGSGVGGELDAARQRAAAAERRLRSVTSSKSYKVGRAVTAPLRALRGRR